MALLDQIPIKAGFTSMGELAELMLKKRALQAEQPLHLAKAREANMMANLYAAAAGLPMPQEQKPEPSMLQKFMNMFHSEDESQRQPQAPVNQIMSQGNSQPINKPYQLSPEEQQRSAQIQPGESLVVGQPNPNYGQMNRKQLVSAANQGTDFFQRSQENRSQENAPQPQAISSGLPQTPQAIAARSVLQHLGKWGEIPSEQEEREVRTDWRKGINKNTTELLGDWGKRISASREMLPILEHNQEIMSSPVMQEVFSHPEYFGADKVYLKKFSKDPTIVEGLSSLTTNVKSLYSIMGQDFKGAFRFYEKKLFDEATPNESDTFGQLIAKNNTLMAIRELIVKRTSLAKQIVEGSNGKISTEAAEEIAEKQINAKEIRQGIKDNFKKMQEDALQQQKSLNATKYTKEQLSKYYADAIAEGIPKDVLDKKLAELRGQ